VCVVYCVCVYGCMECGILCECCVYGCGVYGVSRLGILTEIDDLSVMVAAESLSTFMRNSKILEEKGETYKFTNAKGEVSIKVRPELKIMNDAWIRVFALFKQYGLTHLSRGSISPLPDSEERNPWANLNRRVK